MGVHVIAYSPIYIVSVCLCAFLFLYTCICVFIWYVRSCDHSICGLRCPVVISVLQVEPYSHKLIQTNRQIHTPLDAQFISCSLSRRADISDKCKQQEDGARMLNWMEFWTKLGGTWWNLGARIAQTVAHNSCFWLI